MLIINLSHPLTEEQLAAIKDMVGVDNLVVVSHPVQIDNNADLVPQVIAILDEVLPEEPEDIIVNPPGLAAAAVAVALEIQKRGFNAQYIRIIRDTSGLAPKFVVKEVFGAQQ